MTPQQNNAVERVMDILRGAGQEHLLVFLQGVSGVGKSTILGQIEELVDNQDIIVVKDIRSITWQEKYADSSSHLVIPVTPFELGRLQQMISEHYTKWNRVETVWLRAMSITETLQFARCYSLERTSELRADLELSLGIPLLAKQMIDFNPTKDQAIIMAAEHIRPYMSIVSSTAVVQAEAMQYLGRELPSEVVDYLASTAAYRPLINNHLYHLIPHALEQIEEARQKGFMHVLPFFLAPESKEMYNEMLGGRDGYPMVHIYIPEMSEKDCEDFQYAFEERARYPNRPTVCNGSYRKLGILVHDADGRTHINESECGQIREDFARFREDFRCFQTPLRRTKGGQRLASAFIDTHQHREIRTGPTFNGWAVESWCQQKGIGYIVENYLLCKKYAYLPGDQHIVVFGELRQI
ncbi:MAG: hypothetical protein UT05_C0018G0004 [Parcubacteria group bacterium GW2011_GWF2_38_76]|nr:MAG: hypothetical protein UT05_C0018G0004 [Parcubacteria group bacterium GW2011_GWF2_38_76]